MKILNLQQELEFIHSEKTNISNKKSLRFELLNVAQALMANCISARTIKMKTFYKTVYNKTKNFIWNNM